MPDVLNDKPAANGSSYVIRSPERAAELGSRGGLATKARRAAINKPPDIRRIRTSMDKIQSLMLARPSPQAWDQLSRSYERLFKVWSYLARLPGPGVMRQLPQSNGSRPGVIDIEPEALTDVVQTQKEAKEPDPSPLDSLQGID